MEEEVAGQVAPLLRPVPQTGQQPPGRADWRPAPGCSGSPRTRAADGPIPASAAPSRARCGPRRRAARRPSPRPTRPARAAVRSRPRAAAGRARGRRGRRGGVGLAAPLQPDVVVDADPGQRGKLLPAQPRSAAQSRARRKPHLLGPHLRPAGLQVSAEFGAPRFRRCHPAILAGGDGAWGAVSGPGTPHPGNEAVCRAGARRRRVDAGAGGPAAGDQGVRDTGPRPRRSVAARPSHPQAGGGA